MTLNAAVICKMCVNIPSQTNLLLPIIAPSFFQIYYKLIDLETL